MAVDLIPPLVGLALVGALCAIISLGLSNGALLPLRKGFSGYWGDISSSVDWCEENYMHSHYVAETWNTVTSFIIAVAGLVAAHSARACGAEFRYELLGYLLCIVGLGSIAFHAALQHWMQMLDEVPMLWAAVAACYCIINSKNPQYGGSKGIWLPIALIAWTALITCVTCFTHGTLQVGAHTEQPTVINYACRYATACALASMAVVSWIASSVVAWHCIRCTASNRHEHESAIILQLVCESVCVPSLLRQCRASVNIRQFQVRTLVSNYISSLHALLDCECTHYILSAVTIPYSRRYYLLPCGAITAVYYTTVNSTSTACAC
eukprot:20596-Heterococcus_DN1.PRE.1